MFGFKKKATSEVVSHLLHAETGTNSIMLRNVGFRRGMWVNHEGKIAILIKADQKGVAEIHYVDEDGNTKFVHPEVPLAALEVAKIHHIPKARIKHLSEQQLHNMGYL